MWGEIGFRRRTTYSQVLTKKFSCETRKFTIHVNCINANHIEVQNALQEKQTQCVRYCVLGISQSSVLLGVTFLPDPQFDILL